MEPLPHSLNSVWRSEERTTSPAETNIEHRQHNSEETAPKKTSPHDPFLISIAQSLIKQFPDIDQISNEIRELQQVHRRASAQAQRAEASYWQSRGQNTAHPAQSEEEQQKLLGVWQTSQQDEYEAGERVASRQRALGIEYRHVLSEAKQMIEHILPPDPKSKATISTTLDVSLRPEPQQPFPSRTTGSRTTATQRTTVQETRTVQLPDSEDGTPLFDQLAAKRNIDNLYCKLEEYRDSYDLQLGVYQRFARDQISESRRRFDVRFLLDVQERANEILAAEEAWSEVASRARKAGYTSWGPDQMSRFSQSDDEGGPVQSDGGSYVADDSPWLHAWTQEQLDRFQGNPPIEEDFDGEWRVPPDVVEEVEPAFDKDYRLWRQPEGIPGLPLARFDEEWQDHSDGRY